MGIKLSIITPSYNQGVFLKRTIDSVLEQNVPDLELLVFDGGSTDHSVEILQSYGNRITYVSQKDDGQSDAVNQGLRAARGEIIGWLNSDDVYYSGVLQAVIDVFDKNPDIDVIYGRADHIDVDDRYIEDYYTEAWDYERLKEVCYICQPAVFFRKSIVEKYGVLNKELKFCMDYEYWLRIGGEKPFYFLDLKLAGSRLYSDNKTLGSRKAVHEEIIKMLKSKFGTVPERWIYNFAHVVAEEAGHTRNNPEDNYKFVKKMVISAARTFLRYERRIPLHQIKAMASWVSHAKKKQ